MSVVKAAAYGRRSEWSHSRKKRRERQSQNTAYGGTLTEFKRQPIESSNDTEQLTFLAELSLEWKQG